MTSPSTRRLLKESTDLHKNPSPYFTATPTPTNLHDWHFTLAGPPHPTPYAGGLYHGRITFPPTYPLRPPSFRFLTPSGRFEVNREICLSISGHHEETWQPAWGVRTALLAIRSEVMGGESRGQVGGMEGSEGVRREFARDSRGWWCRECGASNEGIMRGVWGLCREVGVEVDGDLDVDVEVEKEREEREEGEGEGVQIPPVQVHDAASASISAAPEPAPASTTSPVPPAAAPASTDSIHSRPRPTPTTTSTSTTTTVPSNSPWLDRAIVSVVIALILLILRRVTDADEL